MYLYDSAPSHRDRGTVISLGELALTQKRQRITDSTAVPNRWICALDTEWPPGGNRPAISRSTGFLISPRHVLTAAINVVYMEGRTSNSPRTTDTRIDARAVTVTPALDGAPGFLKKKAPVGSVTLKPTSWWVPNELFRGTGGLAWEVAVLTLPQDLPTFHGKPYGHFADTRFGSSIAPVTNESLVGATLTTCGHARKECLREIPVPTPEVPFPKVPEPEIIDPRWRSTQWQTFGRVEPLTPGDKALGLFLYDSAECDAMEGAPVWLNTGNLRLVGIHQSYGLQMVRNPELPARMGSALALRPELLAVIRQQVARAGIQPAF
jgi:hypothetical protein